MKISEVKREFQLQQWRGMILERKESGLSVKEWCSERGITEHVYYYRLRQLRLAACHALQAAQPVQLAEVPLAPKEPEHHASLRLTTMANWVIRCAERYLSLVYDRLRTEICSRHVLQVDETTCQVTKDGRSSDTKSYMFVYRTSEHCPERPVILYQYAMTRSRSNVQRFMKGFSGILESDAFSGYKALDKEKPEIQAAFCWAHARRDYADALKALKDEDKEYASETVAHKALVQIAAIYKAEAALKDKSAADRYLGRQKDVKPLVEAYFAWVREQEPAAILSEKTRDGLKYSLNQEKYLKVFLDNGEVPIDNSATERAIRPFTVGRANWHIIDTVHGAQASAIIYSLVETAKANKLKIYEYLKHLLTEIPKYMDDTNLTFLDGLLPWSEQLLDECRKKT